MKPIKLIQHDALPSDANNDGSAVKPTGPEQSGSASNAIIQRCGSRIDAAHERVWMVREQLTSENIHTADTVSLLRARDVRCVQNMRECSAAPRTTSSLLRVTGLMRNGLRAPSK